MINVLLNNYEDDELRFGDEIEVGIVKVDKVAKTVKICVKSAEIRNVCKISFMCFELWCQLYFCCAFCWSSISAL